MQVVVLGAGESGVGAACLAKAKGFPVFVSEKGTIKPFYKEKLIQTDIPFEEGGHTDSYLFKAEVIVKSPGIPDHLPLIKKLNEFGIPVISEIEFAFRFASGQIIGITGSNGKTTTTRLTHHLLQASGLNAQIGGNVGKSFAALLFEGFQNCLFVLELSSFQLDGIDSFKPDIAAILNITPDHLDRYHYDIKEYAASKFRIIKNQTAQDAFFFNANNYNTIEYIKGKNLLPKLFPVLESQAENLPLSIDNQDYNWPEEILKGKHNRMNAFFAISMARYFGCSPELINNALRTFSNSPHRMELSGYIDGAAYINDSKATNVDAVYYALEAMEKPTIWIVGGQDKGNDYSMLDRLVKERVKAIICLGVDNSKLLDHFKGFNKPMVESNSMTNAVLLARNWAEPGDVVLLSPACASFDLFKNYEDRGDQFKAAVTHFAAIS